MNNETAAKQVAQYTKVVSHIFDMISKAREEWEVESSSRAGVQQTSSLADTQALVSAVGMGKGLKGPMTGIGGMSGLSSGGIGGGGPGMAPGMMVPPALRPQAPMSSISPSGGVNPMGKAPSAIKTNIKSANSIHPYNR